MACRQRRCRGRTGLPGTRRQADQPARDPDPHAPARAAPGPVQARAPAPAAALLRQPRAGIIRRPAWRAGTARARGHLDHADLYAPGFRTPGQGLRRGPSTGTAAQAIAAAGTEDGWVVTATVKCPEAA